MTGPNTNTLYLSRVADRFFLVPAGRELPAGDFTIVTLDGEERHVDAEALAAFEASHDEAQAHLRARAERAVAAVAETIGRVLGPGGESGSERPDLRHLAEQLGVSAAEVRRDPEAAKAAFQRFADDVQAVSSAVARGDVDDLRAARDRLAARGINLGDALDDLPGYLRAIRRLDDAAASRAAARGLRALADAIEGDPAALGRRIDAVLARLERELGPFVGIDRQREAEQRRAEYERSARSAIANALRAAGITPLASAEPEREADPDRASGSDDRPPD